MNRIVAVALATFALALGGCAAEDAGPDPVEATREPSIARGAEMDVEIDRPNVLHAAETEITIGSAREDHRAAAQPVANVEVDTLMVPRVAPY